jgi:alpha-tubulin suppressor-like RCC1 family protein
MFNSIWRSLRRALPLAAMAACGEPTEPHRVVPQPSFDISDGARGGNPHFFFLPPMVKRPAAFNGAFDATLAPEVVVCEWTGTACTGADAARFTFGAGPVPVTVVVADEHYAVNWKTSGLDPAREYRIRVLVGDVELGHADIAVGATGSALRNVDTDEAIPLVDGRTLPIRFRIERGALPSVGWRSIAAGPTHTCALSLAGKAYCWGDGKTGQLGTGLTDQRLTPTPVSTSLKFRQIVVGQNFSCALTEAGAAYCWGENSRGRVGDGTTFSRLAPTAVAGSHVFASLTAGDTHACGLTTTGIALCWGYDVAGELGTQGVALHTADAVLEPDAVNGSTTFSQLSAAGTPLDGIPLTCGVSAGGQALCWGANDEDRLGTGIVDVLMAPTPVLQPASVQFASVHVGPLVTCGRATDGRAWCWGINEFGTGGVGEHSTVLPTPQPVQPPAGSSTPITFTQLSVGEMHACGVAVGGQGWCWGSNADGQAGPSMIGVYGPPLPVAVAGSLLLREISAGDRHTCAITTSNAAVCWGDNTYGQLGNGTATPSLMPVMLAMPSAG